MPSIAFLRSSQHVFCLFRPLFSPSSIRNISTEATLLQQLTSRPPNIIYDYLSPTPSHLLNLSFADFLPPTCYPPNYIHSDLTLPLSHGCKDPQNQTLLPLGHHLVYFLPQIPTRALLPDGTDSLHSPGAPYSRRMWAGGSLRFAGGTQHQLHLHGERAACVERISDITVKGQGDAEKVFVKIERRIGLVDGKDGGIGLVDPMKGMQQQYLHPEEASLAQLAVLEVRNLVFMREHTSSTAKLDASRDSKILRPKYNPDFTILINPTKTLLFRFSALTFNAHAIHLDLEFSRNVEGHRNLLVHGPLTLVLMLSALRSCLSKGTSVTRFEYRNLAPLYAGEEARVCVRKDPQHEDTYDVWIEGQGGGYAVKGRATAEKDIAVPGKSKD